MPTPINHADPNPRCDKCNTSTLRSLLHNDGKKQRLCTNCILRHNSTAFCPNCFAFYDGVPPHISKRVNCIKCKSATHLHCAAANVASYLCSLCKDPSFTSLNPNNLKFDKKQAVILLCAARIAAALMRKAADFARENAGKKAEEAARAKKRAREALDHLVWSANVEKMRKISKEDEEERIRKEGGEERMRNLGEEEEEDEDFAKDLEILLIKEEMDVSAM